MVSTTGEHSAWFVLDEHRVPRPAAMPADVAAVVARIGENCEPALTSVMFLGGAGGSLRAGVTDNPGAADARDQAGAGQRHLRRQRRPMCGRAAASR